MRLINHLSHHCSRSLSIVDQNPQRRLFILAGQERFSQLMDCGNPQLYNLGLYNPKSTNRGFEHCSYLMNQIPINISSIIAEIPFTSIKSF